MKKRSPLWYELPILFSILGGLISYFVIRKDDPSKAKRCIIVGMVFSLPILFSVGMLLFSLGGAFYVVSSGSMMPELEVYDLVTADKNFPFENLAVGDIIVFDRPSDHNRIILHRIVEILNDNPLTFKTKGDANPASIPGTDFPITESEYVGKINNIIPDVGGVTQILRPPANLIIYLIEFIVFLIPIILHIKFRRENRVEELK